MMNDFYSWEKEYQYATDHSQEWSLRTNAVWVLSQIHSVDYDAALQMLRVELDIYEERYLQFRNEYIAKTSPRAEILRILALHEVAMAGCTLWHLTSARYNKDIPAPTREPQPQHNLDSDGRRKIEDLATHNPILESEDPRSKRVEISSSKEAKEEIIVPDKQLSGGNEDNRASLLFLAH